MILTYRDMFAVCAIAACLMAVGRSAPLDCKDLVEPLHQLDPERLEGRWIMVAGSLKITEGAELLEPCDSITIDFSNSSYVRTARYGNMCHSSSQKVSIEGHSFHYKIGDASNFSGTFFQTSCSDCVVLSFVVDSPGFKSSELCLFSRRREVSQKELMEFMFQVACLNMPKHFVMDPNKLLCSEAQISV